jgi:hypothetical protein
MLWSWVPYVVVLAIAAFPVGTFANDQSDRRTFSRVLHHAGPPREVSVYAELRPALDSSEVLLEPLWSGNSLRLLPLHHVDEKAGVFAYAVELLSGESDGQPVPPTDQPGHGITADVIAAFHFRNRDNSGPNAPGPLNVNAPGAFRLVRYPGVTLEIRVLSFEIVNAAPGKVPSFSELSLLITARQAKAS